MLSGWLTSVLSLRYEAHKWSLAVAKLWEFAVSRNNTTRASHSVFPFVKSENNNFVKEILLQRRLGFSLICLWILQNVRFGFHRL